MSEMEGDLYPKEFSEADIYVLVGFLSVYWNVEKLGGDLVEDAKQAMDIVRNAPITA